MGDFPGHHGETVGPARQTSAIGTQRDGEPLLSVADPTSGRNVAIDPPGAEVQRLHPVIGFVTIVNFVAYCSPSVVPPNCGELRFALSMEIVLFFRTRRF